ncbi:RNA polymerase-associated protein RapA [Halioxenophilus sp. WMMB6]|uniref:RNA polymerase-associated protein RapA n=1 Tax=Halioxenophilus sp. WMMB6 TaxID=3073815 RepID=UPI00295EABA4|nr:RNA polymerase-associated protein RapA [Halioxenophilus sp. WMMB6]
MEMFVIGQRWISSAEKELGLGVVIDTRDRRVSLSFPACGEQRTYADNNAPLTRVRYDIGDTVYDLDDTAWLIAEVIDQGHLVYLVSNSEGESRPLSEVELNPFVHFSGPLERLLAGNIDKPQQFQLRLQTLEQIHRLQASGAGGLIGPRVDLLSHQLYIANEVANRFAPRVLLADEVGLGKTIEAGLVIHHQLHNHRAERVLIAVPDSLVHQWLVEMLRRFNLRFTVMNAERLREESASSELNPFDSAQLLLCPISLFVQDESALAQALTCQWDLLCVDEAHHLQWTEQQPSAEYLAIEALAQLARGLLLLTATPEQLGLESHFARLRLLDPSRYHSLEAFRAEEAQYQPINDLIQTLLADSGPAQLQQESSLQQALASYLGERAVQELLAALKQAEAPSELIVAKVRQLLDRHGTGRVLFRNTRASVSGFPKRQLHTYPLPLPSDWQATSLYPEQTSTDDSWLEVDSRISWLLALLKELRREKVLLITANANTALALESYLTLRQGVRASVFHEGMSLLERDRSAAYFADQESGAQILVCSEIGSEGRNFQFAHHLVLFDLPANPDLLEQRIGRLDRIGQQQNVLLHAPYFEQTSQAVLLQWYHQGLNAFEQTCPIGANIREQFAAPLASCLAAPADSTALADLIQQTQTAAAALLSQLQQGRDRLLELNSCNRDSAAATIAEIRSASAEEALQEYMLMAFDQFGVDHQDHSDQSWILHPSEAMHSPFPELPEEGLSVCFNREKALGREELAFLTWEHPMVTATLDMIASGEHGNCSLCSLKLPPIKAGTWLLEAVYVLHCPAPKAHQLNRFLPLTPIRLLLDQNQKNLAGVIAGHQLTQLAKGIAKKPAADIVKHLKGEFEQRLHAAKAQAEKQALTLLQNAKGRLQSEQQEELERLQALAKVNPNIRSEEIDYLREQNQQASHYLSQSQVRLDGLRVIIAT